MIMEYDVRGLKVELSLDFPALLVEVLTHSRTDGFVVNRLVKNSSGHVFWDDLGQVDFWSPLEKPVY